MYNKSPMELFGDLLILLYVGEIGKNACKYVVAKLSAAYTINYIII